ncbi:MAG TPA: RidA family protein [Actinomycetota bacterium]|nr:RidA family protein [Actinomycetota bacterium]
MSEATILERLAVLGLELPPTARPVASYVPVRVVGGLAFVAGQIPLVDGEVRHPGHAGAEVSLDEAVEASRRCALQALAALREELGSLDRLARIVQVTVFVASAPGFNDQPKVANGASDLLVELLGDDGRHARAAVGVVELPLGAPVEVALVAEVSA